MANCNIENRTIFCKDNLEVLEGMNSECVDLIYLDPPFNTKKEYHAPTGSSAEGAKFSDIFKEEDVKDEWLETIKEDYDELYDFLNGIKNIGHKSNFCYLCYMAIRVIEIHRILKDTGSLYLHCDSTMSHYLKIVLDCIFSENNFRRDITWTMSASAGFKSLVPNYVRGHDVILYYSKTKNVKFNKPYRDYGEKQLERFSKFDEDGRKYKVITKERRIYLDESKGIAITDVWSDIANFQTIVNSEEIQGYPTQKPTKLLHRIIEASSNKNDLVLDPFCGCATTCVACEQLERKWIGIDVSIEAYNLVKKRLKKEVKPELLEPKKEVNFSIVAPVRTDIGKDYRLKKWVYVISNPKYEGEYKVGIAKYVEARLNSYQTSDPERSYKLEYKLETPFFREIEKFIHNKFENKHEWVRANLKNIIKEIEDYGIKDSKP